MGDLKGHLAPAALLVLGALWWLVKNLERYFKCQQAGQSSSFRSMASCSELPFFRKKYPKIHFEVLLGTPLLALDFLGELITGVLCAPLGFRIHPIGLQHMTMLSCALVRMVFSGLAFYTTWLPSGAEHGATGIAFILQAPLLLAHSYDKNLTGITIHVTTAICWFAGGLCSFYEMNNRNNIMATLGRCYFLALGSFWFFHAGGVLMHVHPFDMNHMNLSAALQIYYLSIYFVVDALAIMLLFLGICARIYKTTKNEHPNKFYVDVPSCDENPRASQTDELHCLIENH